VEIPLHGHAAPEVDVAEARDKRQESRDKRQETRDKRACLVEVPLHGHAAPEVDVIQLKHVLALLMLQGMLQGVLQGCYKDVRTACCFS
jgi:hypothetical protein